MNGGGRPSDNPQNQFGISPLIFHLPFFNCHFSFSEHFSRKPLGNDKRKIKDGK
jgi:hypothetical protein